MPPSHPSLAALKRTHDDIASCLRSLDTADHFDQEDSAPVIVPLDADDQRHAATCPFTSHMVRSIPLLRQQAVERAELDNLVASSPWSKADDNQLTEAVAAVARKTLAMQMLRSGAGVDEVAALDRDQVLAFADRRPDHGICGEADAFGHLDWTTVAALVPSRNESECRTRWIQTLRSGVSTAPWTEHETAQLKDLVAAHLAERQSEPVPWESIAAQLGTYRTGYSAFVAYCRLPRTSTPFSAEEDADLCTLFELFGGSWNLVALHHPAKHARSSNQLYFRFVRSADPAIARGKWTQEEDARLGELVDRYGAGEWVAVSTYMNGRTAAQCRDRYARTRVGVPKPTRRKKNGASDEAAGDEAAAAGPSSIVARGRSASPAARSGSAPKSAVASDTATAHALTSARGKRPQIAWTEDETTLLCSLLTEELTPRDGSSWSSVAERLSTLLAEQGGATARRISARQARCRADALRIRPKQLVNTATQAEDDSQVQPKKRGRPTGSQDKGTRKKSKKQRGGDD